MEDKNKDEFQQDFDKFLKEQEDIEKEANLFTTLGSLTGNDIEWDDDEWDDDLDSNNYEFNNETEDEKIDKFPILRLIPFSEKNQFNSIEHKIFSKINLIAQKIQFDLGDQHTEITYQNAFAQYLNKNPHYFSYFREFRFDIVLNDNPISYMTPDFLILNNERKFDIKKRPFHKGFFLELKQNNFEVGRDVARGSNDNKKGFFDDSYARKQIWKYLRSSSTATYTPHVAEVRFGVLVNFSGSLQRNNPETLDEQNGAYIEVWKSNYSKRKDRIIQLSRIFRTHKGNIKKEDYQRIYNEYLDKIE